MEAPWNVAAAARRCDCSRQKPLKRRSGGKIHTDRRVHSFAAGADLNVLRVNCFQSLKIQADLFQP